MTTRELTDQLIALPMAERAAVAQEVWESIDDETSTITHQADTEALVEARRRDDEMSRGDVPERLHEEVMKTARQSVQCE